MILVALVYVDDLILTGNDAQGIENVKEGLNTAFTIKDLGALRYFLGLEVARNEEGIILNQRKYIMDIITDLQMETCKTTHIPMQRGLKLSVDQGDLLNNPEQYRRLIGRLLYLNLTRPDLSYSIQHLSQFICQPRVPHMQAAIHLLKYLNHTVNTGLFYPSNSTLALTAYSDADWGQCSYSCRSLTGYCLFLGSSLISWKTKKQKTVSKSSAESEYRSMSTTASEIVWLQRLLQDLLVDVPTPITLHCDNKAAQHISLNPVFHERTKHLEIDCHYIRDKIQEGLLTTTYVPSKKQLADIFTKPLGIQQHTWLASHLGLQMPASSSLGGGHDLTTE